MVELDSGAELIVQELGRMFILETLSMTLRLFFVV